MSHLSVWEEQHDQDIRMREQFPRLKAAVEFALKLAKYELEDVEKDYQRELERATLLAGDWMGALEDQPEYAACLEQIKLYEAALKDTT